MDDKAKKYRKKKKLGSYPFISVVFSITMALFVMGLFGLLILHAQALKKGIKENVEMQVYLNQYITDTEQQRILKTLESKPYVLNRNDEPVIAFISKEEAAKDLVEGTGEEFVELLGENPLRDAYVINIAESFQDPDRLEGVREETENISGVFEVTYNRNMISSINENLTKVSIVIAAFAVILLLVVVILINNTMKLALFSQRFLIRSMQLVGATGGFIRKPFIKRATIHGAVSGVLACALLAGLLYYGTRTISDLEKLQDRESILILFGVLIITGAFIGLLSTFRSVNKYLKMSLDELY
ncbi:cell division protein FtsX [Roseivirga sp. BDSF3-8]|uniref:cell division protein FtsX n=1 Tax=Roseivirga sp. BDSF3-8 TaxID=3241598 RepID=UPI0035319CB4